MSEIPTVEPSKALGDLGEVPRVTTTIDAPAPKPSASSGGELDAAGEAFNPALHQSVHGVPRKKNDGCWVPKKGAFKAKQEAGKPFFRPPPQSTPEGQESPTPGETGTVDAQPVDPLWQEADYEGTAAGLQNGFFAVMRCWLGPAWEPDHQEAESWRGALRRLWCQHQLPRVGPIVEVLMLIPVTIAKRREDAKTKEGWQRIKVWIGLAPKEPPTPRA